MSGRTRWAIGAGIFLSAYLVGYLLSRAPATGDLGVVVAVVGMGLLSWLVPVLLGRGQRSPRPAPAAPANMIINQPPQGYGRQGDLSWNVEARYANDVLAEIQSDGIYEVVSMSPHTVGDAIWATNNRITLHLKMRRGAHPYGAFDWAGERRERQERLERERVAREETLAETADMADLTRGETDDRS